MWRQVMARPDAQLTAYRSLLENARAMLLAAREERWDDLSVLDMERERCLSQAMTSDLVSTQPADIENRTVLIQSILDCDEQTKTLVRAWQSELSEVLGSLGNEQKLADAYRGG